jgi:hypothetical protein
MCRHSSAERAPIRSDEVSAIGEVIMPTEVVSPVTRKGSKVSGNQPLSPGARSNPSRGPVSQDSIPPQPHHGGGGGVKSEDPLPAGTTTVVGPED